MKFGRWASGGWKRREVVCAAACVVACVVVALGGCIGRPMRPAATQPATAIDLATTQPSYWLNQPAVAEVRAADFDSLWEACKEVARRDLYVLDRDDHRAGVITTVPMVSKQPGEFWRHDAGTGEDVFASALSSIRRTLRFEVTRDPSGGFVATPKVLVERLSALERRVSDVSQYRTAFTPMAKTPPKMAVTFDPDVYQDTVPFRYWTPIGRDEAMERQVSVRLERELGRRQAIASRTENRGNPSPIAPRPPASTSPAMLPPNATTGPAAAAVADVPRVMPDGVVSAIGPNGEVYVNVGATDKVVVGMTFEVYDARAVLPTLQAYARDNPGAKGWVEVTAVNDASSTCKVIANAAGVREPPKPGDQIANIVFHRGRPNRFAVFGDLTADRATLTGLIRRWGAAIETTVDTGTDYVILGKPPQGPGVARDVYDAARQQAEQLGVPILSEERFNLFVRYYDPSKK